MLRSYVGCAVSSCTMYVCVSSPRATLAGDLADVLQGMQWLEEQGASKILLFGDSSGGTQVLQLLLWMENLRRLPGRDPGVRVSAAVSFSGWLDMTASSPTYETRRCV